MNSDQLLSRGLLVAVILIIILMGIGGVTRLTHSGLSITEWAPILGAIPPVNEDAWQVAFSKYQLSPEYIKVNAGMNLAGFKQIYFLEWLHRFIGRLIGLVIFIPFLILIVRKEITKSHYFELGVLLLLLALQGTLGWLMVRSGLIDLPRVSPYRLVIHLEAALLLLSVTYYFSVQHTFRYQSSKNPQFRRGEDSPVFHRLAIATLVILGVQIIFGGFVSGLKAGGVSATWPQMDGTWIPHGLLTLKPWLINFTENPITAHFMHRSFSYVAAFACLSFGLYGLTFQVSKRQKVFLFHLIGLVIMQMLLGIGIVLLHVPVWIASVHQVVAIGLWVSVLFLIYSSLPQTKKE